RTNVRIVAATHRDLKALIQQGLFREDLFYRLNVVPMRLPPLRERLDDIGDLTRHFLREAANEGLGARTIEPDAIERLKEYNWPGNVRELENLVRRLSAIYAQETLTRDMVDTELASIEPVVADLAGVEPESLSEIVERHLAKYFSEYRDGLPPPGLYDRMLREVEAPLFSAALAATRGNQIRAAELLGINRNTLRSRIKTLDIKVVRVPSR
ncbi:MAG: helix-turn-helix domain-containing protein, partial [Pseudomonadota bacterium]